MKRVCLIVFIFLMICCSVAFSEEQVQTPQCVYYYTQKSLDAFQTDVSLIVADPFPEYLAISIRLSYPNGFPNDDIEYFNIYINDEEACPLYPNESIKMPYSAPSAFTGMFPITGELNSITIVPVGHSELEEWTGSALTLDDFQKVE